MGEDLRNNVRTLQGRKNRLELEISALLKKFTEETSLVVTHLNADVMRSGNGEIWYITNINTEFPE